MELCVQTAKDLNLDQYLFVFAHPERIFSVIFGYSKYANFCAFLFCFLSAKIINENVIK